MRDSIVPLPIFTITRCARWALSYSTVTTLYFSFLNNLADFRVDISASSTCDSPDGILSILAEVYIGNIGLVLYPYDLVFERRVDW